MPKVEIGDLVCMYRRKNKGVGLVLNKVENIAEAMGLTPKPEEILEIMAALDPFERMQYRAQIIQQSSDPEAAKIFLNFNGQDWCKKPKYKFVKVRWFKKPSVYGSNVREDETWCPQEWLKKVR